ncbi:MAG: DUF4438 domain-containing protein [Acidobacteriota bacterium]|nr:DUF4438 domain-containing protein [Acidobacteriota bacterium]
MLKVNYELKRLPSLLSRIIPVLILMTVLFCPELIFPAPQKLKPVEFNKEKLVKTAVVGQVAPCRLNYPPYRIGADGSLQVLPATGSITYNFRTGDSAVNLAGDHVEPAVTLYNPGARSTSESNAFNVLSGIGNKVRVLDGEAKGAVGLVIGKHGGSEHVMVDFKDQTVLQKLTVGDKMHVYACGVGMELTNVKGIKVMNMSPELMEALGKNGMGVTPEGKLRIPVALKVPAKIMGSGLGTSHAYSGDYDIQLFDEKTVKEYGLDRLRFGDLVAIIDGDSSYGHIYKTGAITVGVISHSTSVLAGHGPGVTILFTSTTGNIEPVIDDKANLKYLLF